MTSYVTPQLYIALLLTLVSFTIVGQSDGMRKIQQAEQLANNGEYAASNIKYQEASQIFFAEQNWPQYYHSRYAITYNYLDLYQFDDAESEVTEAISHLEDNYRDTFMIWQPKLYHAAGQVHLDLHQYAKAISNNRLAMKYYQHCPVEADRIKYTSYMYNNIGSVYKKQRSMDSALFYFQLALPLKTKVLGPNANSTLRTIKAISGIYQDWGQLDKAIETQTIALTGALAAGNKDAEAQAYNGLSQMYQRKRDFETSKKYISKAMEIYKGMSSEFEMDIAHSYHQMGNVLETEKAHEESLQWYTTAKKLYRKIHNGKASYQEGNSTMNLGKAHNYMAQQLQNSSPQYDASHPEVRALRAKSIAYYEENEDIFAEAIGRDHARWIELWLSKGVCLVENRDTIAAHELFQKAYDRAYLLAPDKSYDRSLSCLNLARTTTNPENALQLYQQGLWELSNDWTPQDDGDNPTAEQSFYEDWSVEIMLMKADRFSDLYESSSNNQYLEDGVSTMVAADALLKESRQSYLTTSAKISLGKRGHEIYGKGVELLHTLQNDNALAFQFIEKNKGLVLLEALHRGESVRNLMIPDSTSSRLRRLDDQIAELKSRQNLLKESDRLSELGAQIYDLEQYREDLKNTILKDYPIANRIANDGLVLDLSTAQSELATNEVIYEYLEGAQYLYVLKIDVDSSHLYAINNDDYRPHLDTLLYMINDEDVAKNRSNSRSVWDQYRRVSSKLYKLLLPDHQEEDMLIIPDGQLNYLPFEILTTDEEPIDQINYSRLPYLLKSVITKYAFSASLHYADLHAPTSAKSPLLAVAPRYPANPSGLLASRAGFSALQYIEAEAQSISDIMDGSQLVGDRATVQAFKSVASDHDIIHLAMHAYTHDTDPMLSGMIFSKTPDSLDHILHAYELYNMDIPSQMVVLSACNTGLGQHEKGEGVMSLGRAFRHAGTKNVVMSLWQANDETTNGIMTLFYQNLRDGIPKAKALRNAKIEYLNTGANLYPHFWASFVLLGDDTPLLTTTGIPLIMYGFIGLLLLAIGYYLIATNQS